MKITLSILVFCLFFSMTSIANSSRPICSMQLLCDQIKSENNLLAFSLRENRITNIEKLQKIFLENQVSVLDLLIQKKNAVPAFEFARMVRAIATVRLGSFEEPTIKKIFPSACNRPNAIYIPDLHRVFICPSLMKYPDLTLHQILAHELGHVVQRLQNYVPCFNEFPKAQRDEVFADWVASKILASKLATEKNRKSAEKQALESQLLFLNLACDKPQNTKASLAQSHPNLRNRVEQIFLSQPAFQEALRCHSRNTKSCG